MWRILLQEGSSAKELNESRWFVGPNFLWTYQVPVFETSSSTITETDPEVKKVNSLATTASRNFELERFEHCSSWQRLKKAVALCLLFKKWLKIQGFKATIFWITFGDKTEKTVSV